MASQSLTADRSEDKSNKLARTGSAPEARRRDSFSEFLASARTLWPLSTNNRVTVLPNTPVAPVINIFMAVTGSRVRHSGIPATVDEAFLIGQTGKPLRKLLDDSL